MSRRCSIPNSSNGALPSKVTMMPKKAVSIGKITSSMPSRQAHAVYLQGKRIAMTCGQSMNMWPCSSNQTS